MKKVENKRILKTKINKNKKNEITNNMNNNVKKNKSYENIENKIEYYQDVIQRTIKSVQTYKNLNILNVSDINNCIPILETIFNDLQKILKDLHSDSSTSKKILDKQILKLQMVNDELSTLFKNYGTENFEDIINICMGSNYLDNVLNDNNSDIYHIIKKYVHPINYKNMNWRKDHDPKKIKKKLAKNRIVEDFMIVETAKTFDCFDLARTSQTFQSKVYGIKIALQDIERKKTLIVCGIVDDSLVHGNKDSYIINKIENLLLNKPEDSDFSSEEYERFINSLTIKELLVYNKDELHNRFVGYINQCLLMKQKTISILVKEFLNNELYGQRLTIIQLLLKGNDPEFQYLAYLLYDLLSDDSNGVVDSSDQSSLFDSLPWNIKKYFKDAMQQTIQYTSTLSNFENQKIPLEQQICLLKADDSVKEKAMVKLKEIKSKSEDSGSKARQYLEGLLRIPFGIYKEEHVLRLMKEIRKSFDKIIKNISQNYEISEIPKKKIYSSFEIQKYLSILKNDYYEIIKNELYEEIKKTINNNKRVELISNINLLNNFIKENNIDHNKLIQSGKKADFMREEIFNFIEKNIFNETIGEKLQELLCSNNNIYKTLKEIQTDIPVIEEKMDEIKSSVSKIHDVLDSAVHGHKNAKRQIERIIGQWMNGDQSGYCFGFEGPPGVGKTSLAKKGISYCLRDNDNEVRPFSFIAIGGSSNGSTFDGHNYTYVGSTWGKIVDILIDNKCMNPIIFIDELDKVSRTEHGREIIGILTHLVDTTQNNGFQDKYFNGIDLDLSKALIIFSYNDAELIDKILLDRIHRIKFDHLSLQDKIVITNKYLLPEINKNMGLEDTVEFSDEVIKFIIEKYTQESGVRKLKELLFEIVGEINLEILQMTFEEKNSLPLKITTDSIKTKYLKERRSITFTKIPKNSSIGVINGLWANALGQGGIIPIEVSFYPCSNILDLRLTGMQGDVMKESMEVAKTLAWELTDDKCKKSHIKKFQDTKFQGIHIHCPEGAVPKDGPSAGTAITTAIYSLLNNKTINNKIGITGEINLQGNVTPIGGLDLKILGGIRGGVRKFIFPKENKREFDKFMEKFSENPIIDGVEFHMVSRIEEVFKMVFV